MKAILLGSSRGFQRVDSTRSYPTALHPLEGDKRVLDVLLESLSSLGCREVIFIGGYHIEKVVQAYPNLKFFYHPGWAAEGEVEGLQCALTELSGDVIISRTDVFYSPEALQGTSSPAPITVGACPVQEGGIADSLTHLGRMPGLVSRGDRLIDIGDHLRGKPRAQRFAGFVRATAEGTATLREHVIRLARSGKTPTLAELLESLLSDGARIDLARVPSSAAWREVDPDGNASVFFGGGKADVLGRLRPLLRSASVPAQCAFSVSEWESDPAEALQRITRSLADEVADHWIVRSSALIEDSRRGSAAGRFKSVLGVPKNDLVTLRTAVEAVIRSYSDAGCADPGNQVFVQPQIRDVTCSGVAFTRDLETRAPYVLINYDARSSRTDTVTSGSGVSLQTLVYHRDSTAPISPPELDGLRTAIREIERVVSHDSLDIEFAIDRNHQVHVLQVRPIATSRPEHVAADADFADEIERLKSFVNQCSRRRPHLLGDSTLLANMPDWNPAEMVGTCPSPLALSLYQYLISDREWGEARSLLGYRDTYPVPLIVSLSGRPYVDVRASFNSFLPASLEPSIGEKIVNHNLRQLRSNPELHDKIEFEIVLTCLAFDFQDWVPRLRNEALLEEKEIESLRESLRGLTEGILSQRHQSIDRQIALIRELSVRRWKVEELRDDDEPASLGYLLNDCRRYGTLPFAILARFAFIAKSLLRSLARTGVLSAEEYERVISDIPTVATRISADMRRVQDGLLGQKDFLEEYGHLRPGTYDILSTSYQERPDLYLFRSGERRPGRGNETILPASGSEARRILEGKLDAIQGTLDLHGIRVQADAFVDFVLRSIPAREEAKFEFTKNVCAALSAIQRLAGRVGISLKEASCLSIERLLRLRTENPTSSLRLEFNQVAGLNRKRHELGKSLHLPHIILDAGDVELFHRLQCKPNFITHRSVAAPVVLIDHSERRPELAGKIVLIRNADPGYDWIFSHQIAGLVTEHGGAASHMAIRAAEFNLPSAIGCGEVIFNQVAAAYAVELDCAAQQVRVLE